MTLNYTTNSGHTPDKIILLNENFQCSSLEELNLFDQSDIDYISDRIKTHDSITLNKLFGIFFIVCIRNTNEERYKLKEKSRIAGQKIQSLLSQEKISQITIIDAGAGSEVSLSFAEGLALSSYKFTKYISGQEQKQSYPTEINIFSQKNLSESVREIDILTKSVFIARDLVNEPLNSLNAPELATRAKKLGKQSGFSVEVLEKTEIEKLEMGGLLAVNKGSIDPPTFTIMEYKPDQTKNKKPLLFVGKGIVYDTGGLSIKPTPDSMDMMKSDMGGAASVMGLMHAIAKAQLPIHVISIIPATDNRPDGNAYVPGDIITMHNKKTVEVLNTDAEGRLVLADGLSYGEKYDPELVFTVATLTGAAAYSIGNLGIVTMGNADRTFFEKLTKAGNDSYERIAEFPFWDEYADMLKSEVADMQNLGGKVGGAITAGKFLEKFTKSPFIHLDIAGPAYNKSKTGYHGTGGSGAGVRLLYEFLKNY